MDEGMDGKNGTATNFNGGFKKNLENECRDHLGRVYNINR